MKLFYSITGIKKFLLFTLLGFVFTANGQVYEGSAHKMNSSFSQSFSYTKSVSQDFNTEVFVTTYRLLNAQKKPYLIIKAINNRINSKIKLALLSSDSFLVNSYDVSYTHHAGILIAEGIDSLTEFSATHDYSLLFGFEDTARATIFIYQLQESLSPDAIHYSLEPLTPDKIKKQQDVMKEVRESREYQNKLFLYNQQLKNFQNYKQMLADRAVRRAAFLIKRNTMIDTLSKNEKKNASAKLTPKLFRVANHYTGQILSYKSTLIIMTDTNGVVTSVTEKPGTGDPDNSPALKMDLMDSLMHTKLPVAWYIYDSIPYTMNQWFEFPVTIKNDIKHNRWKLIGAELVYPKVNYYENPEMDSAFFKGIKHHRRGWYEFDVYHNEVQGLSANKIVNLKQKSGEIHYIGVSTGFNPLSFGKGSTLKEKILYNSNSLLCYTLSYYSQFGGFISFNAGDYNSLEYRFQKTPQELIASAYTTNQIFAVEDTLGKQKIKFQRVSDGDFFVEKPTYFEAGMTLRIYHPIYVRVGVGSVSHTATLTLEEDKTASGLVYKEHLAHTYGDQGQFFLATNPPKPTDHFVAPVFGLSIVEKYFQFDIGFNGVFAQGRYGNSALYMQIGLNYPF